MPDLLEQHPWRAIEPPPEVLRTPTMLAPDELALLYTLARDYCSGAGRIVDAGCFVGGSTVALAAGLRDRPDGLAEVIETYDRFEAERYVLDDFPKLFAGMAVGHSFRHLFDAHLAGLERYANVNEGDVLQHPWRSEPIEVLFLDVLKSWEINDFFLQHFFPSLIPGRSIVIQQDYLWGGLPWIHITMELLAECFEHIDDVESTSRVYRLREPIPAELAAISIERDVSWQEKLRLMDRAVAAVHGEKRGLLELARLWLLKDRADRSGKERVRRRLGMSSRTWEPFGREVRAVGGSFAGYPRVQRCVRQIEHTIAEYS